MVYEHKAHLNVHTLLPQVIFRACIDTEHTIMDNVCTYTFLILKYHTRVIGGVYTTTHHGCSIRTLAVSIRPSRNHTALSEFTPTIFVKM